MSVLEVGDRVVIGPAYCMERRARVIHDEVTGVEGVVTNVTGQFALVETIRDEYSINVGRLSRSA